MAEPVEIRRSRAEDVPALSALSNLIWTEENSPEVATVTEAEYAERHPVGGELVAIVGGELAGFIILMPLTRMKSNAHVAQLAIAVHPKHQGAGIGRKLVEAAIEQAKAEGKRKLSLRVMSTNGKAIAFYEKLGFREQGRLVEEFFVGGRYVDDVLMYKMLT